jgi:hypothetical protein
MYWVFDYLSEDDDHGNRASRWDSCIHVHRFHYLPLFHMLLISIGHSRIFFSAQLAAGNRLVLINDVLSSVDERQPI